MGKNIVKSISIYTLLGFLPLSFAFLFTPIYLKHLSEAEYGILSLFNVYAGILAHIYSLGVSPAFSFLYWDHYKNRQKLNQFLSSSIILILIIQSIFLITGLLFGEQLLPYIIKSDHDFPFYPFFILTLIFPVFTVFYELFLNYNRNEGNLKNYSALSISTLVLVTVGSITGVVILDLNAEGAILGRLFGYSIVITLFLLRMVFKIGIKFDFQLSKQLFKYGFPLFLSIIVGALSYSIDRLLIERMWSLEELGIYGFAFVIISSIEVWFNAINNALSPTYYKYMIDDIEKHKKSIRTIAYFIILAVLCAIVVVIAAIKPIIELIIPLNFHRAMIFIPILGISYMGRVFSTLITYIFYLKKQTKFLPFLQVINLILIILFGFTFGKLFGVIGIVYAIFINRIIELLVVKYLTTKIYSFNFKFNKFYLLTIICALSVFASSYLADHINGYFAYCIPLIIFTFSLPLLVKRELKDIVLYLKERKNIS